MHENSAITDVPPCNYSSVKEKADIGEVTLRGCDLNEDAESFHQEFLSAEETKENVRKSYVYHEHSI